MGIGLTQSKGGKLQESSGKYFDKPVRETANSIDIPISKGKRGGSRISRIISMDNDTYHKTKGR